MNKAIASFLLAAVLAALTAQPDAMAQQQTIYKWVDAEGVVHYTAQPPEGVDYEEVGLQTREPVESAAADADAEDGQQTEGSGIPPAQPDMAPTGPDPEMVAERCAQARSNVENLTQRSNVLIRGEDGERRQITGEERERMLGEAQQFIEEWC